MAIRLTACTFLCTLGVLAQGGGTITGTVVDLGGDPVANADIQATNAQTKAVYKAKTSAAGLYTLAHLPAGTYELSSVTLGFMPFVQRGVAVTATQSSYVNLQLQDFNLNTLGDGRDSIIGGATPHATPAGPTPHMPDGHPDLSGVWYSQRLRDPGKREMKAWAEAILKERTENNLDGRGHPKDFGPTWTGHSIGHWEGDTLVVDTVGFNDKTWLPGGVPHTEMMHVTERLRRPDLGHLEIEFTIEDPGAFTKPWVRRRVADLAPNEDVQEAICNENERDREHMVGK